MTNLESLGRLPLCAVFILVFGDGITMIFYDAHGKDLTISADAQRRMGGEALLGKHGPLSSIYYAAHFEIMAFAPPIFGAFRALRRRTKRLDDKKGMMEYAND
ncbi:hypothetical protein [Rhizobium rhizogenes]|uniref:hypothetical protein n=1 Tax=Rhizobium rhizogenes TaxID=359 RepID=UPI001574E7C7|nr:hypothetical protein [Rhizobium rhizogenes]NTF42797.1 hypothetical protein [Rhizobium rhizogenes]